MSFTDQKPWTVTADDTARRWGGHALVCYVCLKPFSVGDVARWVYMNSGPHNCGNFITCVECDGPDVGERFAAITSEFYRRYKALGWGDK